MSLEGIRRKEIEIINRPVNLYRSLVKTDKELSKQLEDKALEVRDSLSSNIFNKTYDNISTNDLHKFIEELISSLYILRKNLPFNFNKIVRFILTHPNIGPIDRNVI